MSFHPCCNETKKKTNDGLIQCLQLYSNLFELLFWQNTFLEIDYPLMEIDNVNPIDVALHLSANTFTVCNLFTVIILHIQWSFNNLGT